MAMTNVQIIQRTLQRSTNESNYVNTLNLHARVTIDFVWYPGAADVTDSRINPFVVDHPITNQRREITYTWTPQGREPVTRVMNSGRITIPLAAGASGTLRAFGTTWLITRWAAAVNMTPVNQLRGVQQRLDRLGFHLRAAGAQASGIDNTLGARTERAVLCFQAAYRPLPPGPAARLQVRGEWTNNTAANYQNNLNAYNNNTAVANPSTADATSFQNALVAYVGA
ncbi:MAG: hypothetical protein NTU53_18895 [Planctomycetota bacterium]|nr:hypothetical protein [Planctomycetota bacterium]